MATYTTPLTVEMLQDFPCTYMLRRKYFFGVHLSVTRHEFWKKIRIFCGEETFLTPLSGLVVEAVNSIRSRLSHSTNWTLRYPNPILHTIMYWWVCIASYNRKCHIAQVFTYYDQCVHAIVSHFSSVTIARKVNHSCKRWRSWAARMCVPPLSIYIAIVMHSRAAIQRSPTVIFSYFFFVYVCVCVFFSSLIELLRRWYQRPRCFRTSRLTSRPAWTLFYAVVSVVMIEMYALNQVAKWY